MEANKQIRYDRKFDAAYRYDGSDLGAVCAGGRTVFKLWSPEAELVEVSLYRDGVSDACEVRPLRRGGRGVWSLAVDEDLHGTFYDYTVQVGGRRIRTADPYAMACGCNGARSMVVDLSRTDPEGFDRDCPPPAQPEQIIYELHVKDFSYDPDSGVPPEYRGKFKAFSFHAADGRLPRCMEHLRSLGVAHVQLMPVFDFGSVDEAGDGRQFNWGYDPVNYNVPEGSYSTDPSDGAARIRECKEMIQALHANGLRVVMDVVYNHTYREDSWLERSAPGYYYRRWEDGKDWGRDTMIALGGCCLATRRYDEARSILETFLAYCRRGLMPNLFPEGKDAPRYNTVDASLLFILSVYDYLCRTGDRAFAEKAYDAMADIIGWYEKGTDFAIRMEEDGLIAAGSGLDQVTWMDVNVDGILPTPRHGKPVEINAYWYNALRIMARLTPMLGRGDGAQYAAMAERTKNSFQEKFWNGPAGCLRDVLSGTRADEQIRCNQIWAVSLPFSILSPEQERQVVETVFEKLYTPYGLRTLDPADPEFQSFYGGDRLKRDLAYHQGTVWAFPLGGYYLAYLKVHDYSQEALDTVRRQLEAVRSALREGCAGQLPEIYDGGDPVTSKGCFAQAWSVGELLRVYDALEGRLSQAAEGGPSGRWAAGANNVSQPLKAI